MSDGNLDVETILAEVQAEEAAAESGGQEEAPNDSGLEDGQDDDAGYGEDDDQPGESELQDDGDDEGQEDDEELEGDESEEPDEGDEGEELEGDEESEESSSAETNPLQGRLDQVEQELRLMRQEREQRQRQAQARQQQQPRRPATNPEVVEATRIALFGGESAGEQLQQKFTPEVARLGIAKAREANEMAILQATDPQAYYQKHLAPTVNAHIRAATSGLEQSNRQTADMAAMQQHDGHLSQPGAMDRVCGLLESLPLGGTFEENLAMAVEVDKARSGSPGRAKKNQREKARARDVAAKGTAKRRRGRGRRRSGAKPKAKKHDMDDVMGDVAYLQEQERLGLLKEAE